MTQYVLLPGADTAKLGAAHYLFDRSAIETNVVSIPTQRISSGAAKAIARLERENLRRSPRTRAEIEALFRKPAEFAFVHQLIRAGYLDPVEPRARASRRASPRDGQRFTERGLLHFFKKHTFFNLPDGIEDEAVDVGLFGVPFSSTGESTGSIHAPGFLRSLTGRRAFWFDVHRDGFHTDVGSAGRPRGVLGKGVVAKDSPARTERRRSRGRCARPGPTDAQPAQRIRGDSFDAPREPGAG